jgi:hypothetical protein
LSYRQSPSVGVGDRPQNRRGPAAATGGAQAERALRGARPDTDLSPCGREATGRSAGLPPVGNRPPEGTVSIAMVGGPPPSSDLGAFILTDWTEVTPNRDHRADPLRRPHYPKAPNRRASRPGHPNLDLRRPGRHVRRRPLPRGPTCWLLLPQAADRWASRASRRKTPSSRAVSSLSPTRSATTASSSAVRLTDLARLARMAASLTSSSVSRSSISDSVALIASMDCRQALIASS